MVPLVFKVLNKGQRMQLRLHHFHLTAILNNIKDPGTISSVIGYI